MSPGIAASFFHIHPRIGCDAISKLTIFSYFVTQFCYFSIFPK
jgi:hypothetical protein